MEQKPKALASILSEAMLIRDFLGIQEPKSGRSRVVSSWINQGLKCLEISERRYFFEEDVIEFFWKKYKEMAG